MKILTILFILLNQSLFAQFIHKSNGELIKHTYYSLSYVEKYEQAEWVYYILTPEMNMGEFKRSGFILDPLVSTKSANTNDYTNSGFDRGHLAPFKDMELNELSAKESFYMSNISPQAISLNRGAWKILENNIRKIVIDNKILHIISGPIFKNNLGKIGKNNVTIPGYFYKIIYIPNKNIMISYILPNKKIEKDLNYYTTSVDKIESLTGIDFFSNLPIEIENKLEREQSKHGISFD